MTEEPAREVVMPKSYDGFNAINSVEASATIEDLRDLPPETTGEPETVPLVDGAQAIDSVEASIATPAPEDIAREKELADSTEDSNDWAMRKKTPAPSVDKRPHYQCDKKVYAHKIAGLKRNADNSVMITPAEPGFTDIRVLAEFAAKHDLAIGNYIVYYEDGYVSVSPAKPFEAGYTLIEE